MFATSNSSFNNPFTRHVSPQPGPSTTSDPVPVIKAAAEGATAHDQVVTPWDVKGSVSEDGKQLAIDYSKLIVQFGTVPIDAALLERFEKLTGHRPHLLLRRGTFFSHRQVHLVSVPIATHLRSCYSREFNRILDRYEQGKPFYLYTGRGPSSDSMHLGHMVPFVFTK